MSKVFFERGFITFFGFVEHAESGDVLGFVEGEVHGEVRGERWGEVGVDGGDGVVCGEAVGEDAGGEFMEEAVFDGGFVWGAGKGGVERGVGGVEAWNLALVLLIAGHVWRWLSACSVVLRRILIVVFEDEG